jgi:hypothetical protein
MDVDYHRELLEQLQWHWANQLRPRLDGLTDAEYFWEPAGDCWSIRPRDDGSFSCDWATAQRSRRSATSTAPRTPPTEPSLPSTTRPTEVRTAETRPPRLDTVDW